MHAMASVLTYHFSHHVFQIQTRRGLFPPPPLYRIYVTALRCVVPLPLHSQNDICQLINLARQLGNLHLDLSGRVHVIVGKVGTRQRRRGHGTRGKRPDGRNPRRGQRVERAQAHPVGGPLLLLALRGCGGGTHPGTGDLAPGHPSVVAAACGIGRRGVHPRALESGVLVVCHLAANELVEHDGADDGEVGNLEEEDAGGADFVVRGEEQPQGPEDDEGKEVEGRIEVGEPVGRRGLEDVDAVDVEILLASVADHAGKGVGEHTYERSG